MRDDLLNALLETLIETGAVVDFYGASECQFRLGLHGALVTFEIREDPEDGYRSSMDGVFFPDKPALFFEQPIAQIQIRKRVTKPEDHDDDPETWELVDKDGHIWLEYGTHHSDSYYPSFVFDYSPKAGVQ